MQLVVWQQAGIYANKEKRKNDLIFSLVFILSQKKKNVSVVAIMAIREEYLLKKNWTADPCNPKVLLWNGVTCNYGIATPPRIITL